MMCWVAPRILSMKKLFTFTALVLLFLVGDPVVVAIERSLTDTHYAHCGDCYCIPGPDENCPNDDRKPRMNFTKEEIDHFRTQKALNPFTLDCNPYNYEQFTSRNCTTAPSQNETIIALGEKSVCGIKYAHSRIGSSSIRHFWSTREKRRLLQDCPTAYELISYESMAAAHADQALITHTGGCGVCSTTKDLAAYLNHPDLTSLGTLCVTESIVSFDKGVDCFTDHGFTKDCAKMWIYDGIMTRKKCIIPCLEARIRRLPNNGPSPLCNLNECLECDEEISGPLFKQFAARTRRRSGLLSTIARPCRDIVTNVEHNPCPRVESS